MPRTRRPASAAGAGADGAAGIALPSVLLALVAVALLTAALVAVAAQAALVVDARAARLQARLAAESAARVAAAGWSTAAAADLPVTGVLPLAHASGSLGAAAHEASAERLDEWRFLIRAAARVGSGAGAAAGLVLRGLAPAESWRGFGAALSVAGAARIRDGAVVTGGVDPEDLGWPPDLCPPSADSITTKLFGPPPWPAVAAADTAVVHVEPGALVDGGPPIAPLPPTETDEAVLGPLDRPLLERIADRTELGTVRPAAALSAGECATDAPANWGSPLDPAGPCGGFFPLVFAPGPLLVDGGAGQGIVVVDGDLTFGSGTSFFGIAIAFGRVTVEHGAVVFGAIRAFDPGDAAHVVDGRVAYSPCAILRALRGAQALDRAFLDAPRAWIPLF